MSWTHCLSYFFAGLFLTNALPHFVSGVQGRAFQTPFARPPGRGLSSSIVNVLWGFFNLVIGYVLLCRVGHFDGVNNWHIGSIGLGTLLMAVVHAWTFGRLHGGSAPRN
jgi:hypothetical protein